MPCAPALLVAPSWTAERKKNSLDEEGDQSIDKHPRTRNKQVGRNGPPDSVAGYQALPEDLLYYNADQKEKKATRERYQQPVINSFRTNSFLEVEFRIAHSSYCSAIHAHDISRNRNMILSKKPSCLFSYSLNSAFERVKSYLTLSDCRFIPT